jgi:hypothetical protein
MNRPILICSLALIVGWTAQGGIIYSSFANGGNIPDGSPVGSAGAATVSGYLPTISDISVTLNISGGYNGDLYGYLSYDGKLLPLLNRVGMGTGSTSDPTYYFGYGDAGFNNVTLADSGSVNIHNYGGNGVPTGTYAPDSGGLTFAGTFGGLNPNGTWTLFLADLSSGGGQSQLTGWSLDITAVPEPANVALGIFAGIVVLVIIARTRPVRNRIHHWRAAVRHWIDAV